MVIITTLSEKKKKERESFSGERKGEEGRHFRCRDIEEKATARQAETGESHVKPRSTKAAKAVRH